MKELTNKDQITLLKIKSLLNDLSYIVKDEHIQIVDEFQTLCRKYCSFGEQDEES
jgi:preprotein translocase subunit SecA